MHIYVCIYICMYIYIYIYMYIYYIYAFILQIKLLLFLDFPIVDRPILSERKEKTNLLVCVTFLMKK